MAENAKPSQTPKPDDPEQSKRFEETARQLEVDENGVNFNKAVSSLVPEAKAKPKPTGKVRREPPP